MEDHSEKKTFEFQSEARQVLDLMIHSVYSNPDIFLRELVSNASDALDKLRIESLADETLAAEKRAPRITITADQSARTIEVRDNGIGMSREEMISCLGTVAHSGTRDFIRAMDETGSDGGSLIGQFGVGFYSSFIVADRVTVVSRRAGASEAWRWESDGTGQYTIEPTTAQACGTVVTLHIKAPETGEVPSKNYLSDIELRSLIKKYSDFVSYPIYLPQGGRDGDPVNSMKALWTRPESEVTDDEYSEFYKSVARDWDEPLERIVYRAEGTNEFHALLFIPQRPPLDLFYRDGAYGIELYIKRVFIMNDCRELLPDYLRFIRGVVDSEDLPLNISREILQQDRRTAAIKRGIARKVLETLRTMKADREESYREFWNAFGQVIKEGIVGDERNRDAIMKLCLFETTAEASTTLDDYVSRMKDGQKSIYFITGGTPDVLRSSPKLELFKARGIEVLILGHPIDEFWVSAAGKYGDHEFVSASASNVEIPGGEQQSEDAHEIEQSGFASRVKESLAKLGADAENIEAVELSSRLVDSPATFAQRGALITPQMRAMFKAIGQQTPPERRVLELNPSHPLVKLAAAASDDDMADWARVLVGMAQTADGEPVTDGAEFARTLAKMLAR